MTIDRKAAIAATIFIGKIIGSGIAILAGFYAAAFGGAWIAATIVILLVAVWLGCGWSLAYQEAKRENDRKSKEGRA